MFARVALPEVGGPLHCRPLFSSLSFFLISFTSARSCLRSALSRCRSAFRTVLSPRLANLSAGRERRLLKPPGFPSCLFSPRLSGVYLNSPDIPCSGMDRGVLVLTRLWLGSWLCLHISHRMQDGHTLAEKHQSINATGNKGDESRDALITSFLVPIRSTFRLHSWWFVK